MHEKPLGPPHHRLRLRRPGLTPLLCAAVPILIMLQVWQQASVDHLVLRSEKEKDSRRDLESRVNALRLEANRLSSLGQVENRAEQELGLGRPDTDQIVDLVFSPSENDRQFVFRSLVSEANAATHREGTQR
jgi:cell division protein FtsL